MSRKSPRLSVRSAYPVPSNYNTCKFGVHITVGSARVKVEYYN